MKNLGESIARDIGIVGIALLLIVFLSSFLTYIRTSSKNKPTTKSSSIPGFSRETNKALDRAEERMRERGINPDTLSNRDERGWQIATEEIQIEAQRAREEAMREMKRRRQRGW